MQWSLIPHLLLLSLPFTLASLECDPTSNIKKPDPSSPESYLYCNLEGSFSKRKCASGKIFNSENGECDSLLAADDPLEILSQTFNQAPDDLCGAGIPLTILSAPVTCNPSISSCPDGYTCQFYERTGSSYCCQNPTPTAKTASDKITCGENRVTYVEMTTGKPRSCVLSDENSCPTGFGCTLVSGTTTRCCAKDMGCPINSAPRMRGSQPVECSPTDGSSCKNGYVCSKSQYLNKFICCSNPDGDIMGSCPGGETPLEGVQCSASLPCPNGFSCNDKKCCPYASVCPAGPPLQNGPMKCNENSPCPEGYSCVSNAGVQYCCPSKEKVCSLARNGGVQCASAMKSLTRYYFDISTATCRSFKFTQCGGNANNFGSLEECEGFCVDTQCPNGQAHRIGAVNANCALASSVDTCPKEHFCQLPLFGPNPICCPTPELTCNEMVSAGTPCFGRGLTIQRYYFNPSTQKCQPFHYYGCNGNGNNFESIEQCQNFCLHSADNVCDGLAPLKNPNREIQRCNDEDPCPSGYECNEASYCCPTPENACTASMSRGTGCKGSTQRSMWFYDKNRKKCLQFVYNGCGGTANRFTTKNACIESCVQSSTYGLCPRGMTPFTEDGEITPKTCTLNVRATCPGGASCVKSSTNQPICCKAVTACPNNRIPYTIPGSNSVVACSIERDDCPDDFQCLESSTVPGFHMCCSAPQQSSQRPQRPIAPVQPRNRKPFEPDTFAELLSNISPCPPQLTSTGQTCTVNSIGDCPKNSVCFRDVGYRQGVCCRTTPPKCSQRGYVPVFLDKTQVQICQIDIDGCPEDSKCMTSSVAKLAICCQKYQPPNPRKSVNQGSSVASSNDRRAVCANGETPYQTDDNKFQECNFVRNTCPAGYQCEFSSTGQAVCCTNSNIIRCPAGSSVFEYGGRPLACPAGSTKCPQGYSCMPSTNPKHHLCCSSGTDSISHPQPQCLRGMAYVNPVTNERQFCSPMKGDCPAGYTCFESDMSSKFICCTHGDLSDRFQGYCPPRQIPYISRDGFPPACHMQLSPCPTTAPYVCIYSPEKQDSYCCAPIDTAVHVHQDRNGYASPARKTLEVESESNVPGMTQTFLGGPAAPGMGPIGVADPIPGIDQTMILPPALAQAEMEKKIREQFSNRNDFNNGGLLQEFNTQNSQFSNQFNAMETNSGCPLGSRPLIGFNQQITECSSQPCPDGFSCVFAEKDSRFQCCSSVSIMLAVNKPGNQATTQSPSGQIECPPGFFMMDGKCLKILFAGQKGCISDEQCSSREPNSTCDNGYCICPTDKPLVHGGKCISSCPEGFSNIAGRCYDPTTVIFMDSVDERKNGTIGGYCLDTLVEEKRCLVENSYCSEKTITCTCQLGYDLDMDFKNSDDNGKCKKNKDSKYHDLKPATPSPIDDGLYFIDISSNVDSALNDTGVENDDLNKYLFQSDEMIPVFA